MADTLQDEPDGIGDGADGTPETGGTRWLSEAERRAHTDAWRDETQSPWEAKFGGLVIWSLWRAVFKGFQPAWLIASLLIALYYLLIWLGSAGGVSGVTRVEPGQVDRVSQALQAATLTQTAQPENFWNAQMAAALTSGGRREADIDLFRSWARIGPDMVGRDQLALSLLSGAAGPDWLDARLRAGAPGERERRLEAAVREALIEGEARGLQPPQLVFADPGLVDQYEASQFRWSVAETSARGFFRGQQLGEFAMRSLPGLVSPEVRGPARLFGGVRHLMIQACARPDAALEGCEARIIPSEPSEDIQLALAALEAGLVQLHIASSEVRAGAETLQAAREAGWLSPALEAELAGHLASLLPPDRVLNVLQARGVRADLAFAAPDRAGRTLYLAVDLRTADSAVALSELLRDLAALRQATTPVQAIRLVEGLENYQDVRQLRRLSEILGEGTLAARQLLGPGALTVLDAETPEILTGDPVAQRNAMLALISAACVLLLTLIRLITPRHVRRASWTNLADAWMSRLTLGRKT
ncbi:hypothetical protein [Maricaulis parjimensis]|uniref:hypothetical protein n=1 Tax=Maricaulis parjimensis TaxID=144023 RepID=UPI001939975A|nr:hypothetical protein [Maricaulis parjimensis]